MPSDEKPFSQERVNKPVELNIDPDVPRNYFKNPNIDVATSADLLYAAPKITTRPEYPSYKPDVPMTAFPIPELNPKAQARAERAKSTLAQTGWHKTPEVEMLYEAISNRPHYGPQIVEASLRLKELGWPLNAENKCLHHACCQKPWLAFQFIKAFRGFTEEAGYPFTAENQSLYQAIIDGPGTAEFVMEPYILRGDFQWMNKKNLSETYNADSIVYSVLALKNAGWKYSNETAPIFSLIIAMACISEQTARAFIEAFKQLAQSGWPYQEDTRPLYLMLQNNPKHPREIVTSFLNLKFAGYRYQESTHRLYLTAARCKLSSGDISDAINTIRDLTKDCPDVSQTILMTVLDQSLVLTKLKRLSKLKEILPLTTQTLTHYLTILSTQMTDSWTACSELLVSIVKSLKSEALPIIESINKDLLRSTLSVFACSKIVEYLPQTEANEFIVNTIGIDCLSDKIETGRFDYIDYVQTIREKLNPESRTLFDKRIPPEDLLSEPEYQQWMNHLRHNPKPSEDIYYDMCLAFEYGRKRYYFLNKNVQVHDSSAYSVLSEFPPTGFNAEIFKAIYPLASAASKMEGNNAAIIHAFKLSVLFTSVSDVEAYLEDYRKKHPGSIQPFHDACLFEIPSAGIWDVTYWRQFAKQVDYDTKKMVIFADAVSIEAHLNRHLTPPHLIDPIGKKTAEQLKPVYRADIAKLDSERTYQSEADYWQTCLYNFNHDVEAYIDSLNTIRSGYIEIVEQCRGGNASAHQDSNQLHNALLKLYYSLTQSELETYASKACKESIARELAELNQELKNQNVSAARKAEIKNSELPKRLQDIFSEDCWHLLPKITDILAKSSNEKLNFLTQLSFDKFLSFFANSRLLHNHSYKSFRVIMAKALFGDISPEDFETAILLSKKGLSKESVLKAIKLQNEHRKNKQDYIPELHLDGKVLDHDDFYIEKIPRDDISIFVVGRETNCCQHLDGHSKDCVVHSGISPYGGVYRIMKRTNHGPIMVAQSWATITLDNELLLDSIEGNDKVTIQSIGFDLLELMATDVLLRHPEIIRVIFGGGGGTPRQSRFPLLDKKSIGEQESYAGIIGYWQTGYDSKSSRYIISEQGRLKPELVEKLAAAEKTEKSTISDHVSADGFTRAKGIDTYVSQGDTTRTMALEPFRRNRFFKAHPRVDAMLRTLPNNPLVEEGYYRLLDEKYPRQHYGELIFTFEALNIFLQHKIVEKSKNDPRYHVDNFIFANNENDLKVKLRGVNLQPGENILIGYCNNLHKVTAYIQNVDGEIKCFLNDPESPLETNSVLYQSIANTIRPEKMIRLTAKLQIDADCSTFAIKALMFYAKHGKTLFNEIDKPENLTWNKNVYDLLPAKTPAQLLKMAHSPVISEEDNSSRKHTIAVSNESLSKTVSCKSNMTLAQYIAHYRRQLDGKDYSTATVAKKYQYFDTLETLLCGSGSEAEHSEALRC